MEGGEHSGRRLVDGGLPPRAEEKSFFGASEPVVGDLSASEKKTIQFGLAVAIISSCPPQQRVCGVGGNKENASSDPEDQGGQTARQLQEWQRVCLRGLAEQAGVTLSDVSRSQHQRDESRRKDHHDGPRLSQRAGVTEGGTRKRALPASCKWTENTRLMPLGRPLTSDAAPFLRALETAALAGSRTDSAREVQKRAVGGLWGGECSPRMISKCALDLLEQVSLRGQGGSGYQVYANVLDTLVLIVHSAVEKAAGPRQSSSPGTAADNDVDWSSSAQRRLEMAFAVSEAFDVILVRLAQSLRDNSNRSSGCNNVYNEQDTGSNTALARALGAGLYLDAHEAVVMALLRVVRPPPSTGERDESLEKQRIFGQQPVRQSCGTSGEWEHMRKRGENWFQEQLEVLGKS